MHTYVLSSEFDYSRSISPASGPTFAGRMGWATLGLDHIEESNTSLLIVDNRLTEQECEALPARVRAMPDHTFLFRVVDPYVEWCQGHWYYRMLFAVASEPNVCFFTPYIPTELVEDLGEASGGHRLFVVPYPYPQEFEVDVPQAGRRGRLLFSGNQDRHVYPYRYRLGRLAKWWPFSKVDVLVHPGYTDIGEEKKHDTIGAKYVAHLAEYSHVFLSPSRCRLEFLKYGECAAAGSVPVGVLPAGLPAEAEEPFVELDFGSVVSLERSVRRTLQMPLEERQARADAYRAAMKKHRDPHLLNERLGARLDSLVR